MMSADRIFQPQTALRNAGGSCPCLRRPVCSSPGMPRQISAHINASGHGSEGQEVPDAPGPSPRCAPPCSQPSRSHAPHAHAMRSPTRRKLLGVLTMGPACAASLPAHALKTVELRDGTKVDVFEHGMSLSIVALRGSVPAQWITDYRATLGKYAGFGLGQRQQLMDIFQELSHPEEKQSSGAADVVTLGDAWLAPAIQQQLVQPIPHAEHSRWWRMLGPRWHALLRRDASGLPSPRGHIYAAPYRWGATAVAYREDRLERWGGRPITDWEDLLQSYGGKPITDWKDLLQPQLRGRVAFLDSSRQLVAIALKSLGLSANISAEQLLHPSAAAQLLSTPEQDPSSLGFQASPQRHRLGQASADVASGLGSPSGSGSAPGPASGSAAGSGSGTGTLPPLLLERVRERVAELRAQALVFSSRDHIRALTAGDAWAAVGSAQDLIGVSERMSSIKVVAPRSGCLLHADMWAVPAGAKGGSRGVGPSPLLPSWLEFGLSPARGLQHSGLKTGLVPLALPEVRPSPSPSTGSSSMSQSTDAGRVDDADLAITHDNGHLPGRAVLWRSEFLLPLDVTTSQLYQAILRGS